MPPDTAYTLPLLFRPLAMIDSMAELTDMLHRAFKRLGSMGLNCTCVDQTLQTTLARIAQGECFVALYGKRIVGTITLYRPDANATAEWYRSDDVASIHQLAVDPDFQGWGIGQAMLQLAEHWAWRRGYRQIALDTAQPAGHLLSFYGKQGYQVVESIMLPGRNYRSVVMNKTLVCTGLQ
ncbi:GNAT family N-acetyltransferase [Chitinivorax sp. B]|uniref:GNAT family N-acetyltransferase n=1 Tax=Chitinivorax sp. B TaxID=2502235 RepID=UPI0010F51E4E|nr:GNAT family N-acetyltransferase [Chitinivorax sp. B]